MRDTDGRAAFAQRLRSLRGKETRADFANRIGESESTLGNYERGDRVPPADFLMRLKLTTGVDLNWLVAEEGKPAVRDSTAAVNPPDGIIQIPHFEIRAAAGAGALVVSENVSSYFAAEREWLRRMLPSWAAPNAVVGILEGSGDSMEPTIRDGDLVMAVKDPPEFAVDRGGVFLLLHHGHLRIKRLHVDMRSGDITLISDNQRYPPEIVPRDRQEYDLQVLAQIFFAGGRLRS